MSSSGSPTSLKGNEQGEATGPFGFHGKETSMVSTQGVEPYRYRCGSLVRFDELFVSVMTSYPSSLIMRLDFLFFLII